jgi:hypothetical protein
MTSSKSSPRERTLNHPNIYEVKINSASFLPFFFGERVGMRSKK